MCECAVNVAMCTPVNPQALGALHMAIMFF